MLFERGANANIENNNGNTSLHIAVEKGNLEAIKLLVNNKANVNAKNKDGNMLLHLASKEGNLGAIKLLVNNKANIDAKNKDDNTPLYTALQQGQSKAAIFLVEHGADVNAKNKDGKTPLSIAIRMENLEAVKFLLKRGADINIQDKYKLTPLQLAIQENTINIAEFIVNHIAKLEAAGLYVSPENLQQKSEFISNSQEQYNEYSQHFQKCMKKIKKLEKENKPLHDFVKESDPSQLVRMWEENQDIQYEFDDQESLKKQHPEYANILINKANNVKKEIFLHNHAPSIPTLKTHYKRDFHKMTFAEIEIFFQAHRDDFKEDLGGGGITLFNFIEIKDVEASHVPSLKVQAFTDMVKNNPVNKKLDNLETKQHQAAGPAIN